MLFPLNYLKTLGIPEMHFSAITNLFKGQAHVYLPRANATCFPVDYHDLICSALHCYNHILKVSSCMQSC